MKSLPALNILLRKMKRHCLPLYRSLQNVGIILNNISVSFDYEKASSFRKIAVG